MSDENQIPLSSGVRRLLTSSKAIVAGVAVVGVIVMNVTGRIDSAKALEFITWVVMAYFGANALEDAAEKRAGSPWSSGVSPEKFRAIMDAMAPLIAMVLPKHSDPSEPSPVSEDILAAVPPDATDAPEAPPTPRN